MVKRIGFAVILWVIPYVAAIPLLSLSTSQPVVFHVIVGAVATVVASVLLVLYFKDVNQNYFKEAVILSITWVIVNWLLDVVGLLPFSHQSFPQYFLEVGMGYIFAMAPALAIGYLLDYKKSR